MVSDGKVMSFLGHLEELRHRLIKSIASVLLLSIVFYFLVLPLGIKFLLGFQTERLLPLIKIGDYVSFVAWMVLAFGLVFQLPILTFFLGKIGLVSSLTLRKGRKYPFLGILILAAVLTPSPDVFSQLLLAIPLYVLYEVSIIVVRITAK